MHVSGSAHKNGANSQATFTPCDRIVGFTISCRSRFVTARFKPPAAGTVMVDYEMFSGKPDGSEIDYERRAVIKSWLEKASTCGGSFEPFIYRWMSFNGWLACVTGEERDGAMLDEFTSDKTASATFDALMKGSAKFREAVTTFAKLWPIFNAAHVYNMGKKRPRAFSIEQRPAYVRALLPNKDIWRRPRDWNPDKPSAPRLKDLIDAIYQVRCNLFHGDKVSYVEIDSELIGHADTGLRLWLDESRCYEWPTKVA